MAGIAGSAKRKRIEDEHELEDISYAQNIHGLGDFDQSLLGGHVVAPPEQVGPPLVIAKKGRKPKPAQLGSLVALEDGMDTGRRTHLSDSNELSQASGAA